MASSPTLTPRTPRERLRLPSSAEATPIPPRLRTGSDMRVQMHLNPSSQTHGTEMRLNSPDQEQEHRVEMYPRPTFRARGAETCPRSTVRGYGAALASTSPDWLDDDEFSIQGPSIANAPVSTATIPLPKAVRPPPPYPDCAIPLAPRRTRALSSPPIYEPSTKGYPSVQFPFPTQTLPTEATDAMRASLAELALSPSCCSCSLAGPFKQGSWLHDKECEYIRRVSNRDAEEFYDCWKVYSSKCIAWP